MLTLLRVTAVAQIAQGCLDLLAAVMMAFMAFVQGSAEIQEQLADNPVAEIMPAFAGVLAAAMFAVGGMRIAAGIMNWQFRGYALSLVAAGGGMISVFTCYCIPTALTVLILTLVALLNGQVREAFDRRARGESARDVEAWLSGSGDTH